MAEIIHHDDSSSSGAMVAIVAIVILAVIGVFVWRYWPKTEATPPAQPGASVDINFPGGNNSGSGNTGGTTY